MLVVNILSVPQHSLIVPLLVEFHLFSIVQYPSQGIVLQEIRMGQEILIASLPSLLQYPSQGIVL